MINIHGNILGLAELPTIRGKRMQQHTRIKATIIGQNKALNVTKYPKILEIDI